MLELVPFRCSSFGPPHSGPQFSFRTPEKKPQRARPVQDLGFWVHGLGFVRFRVKGLGLKKIKKPRCSPGRP